MEAPHELPGRTVASVGPRTYSFGAELPRLA